MKCIGKYAKVFLNIQGEYFEYDLYVIILKGICVVLGLSWLHNVVKDVHWSFTKMIMTFEKDG